MQDVERDVTMGMYWHRADLLVVQVFEADLVDGSNGLKESWLF